MTAVPSQLWQQILIRRGTFRTINALLLFTPLFLSFDGLPLPLKSPLLSTQQRHHLSIKTPNSDMVRSAKNCHGGGGSAPRKNQARAPSVNPAVVVEKANPPSQDRLCASTPTKPDLKPHADFSISDIQANHAFEDQGQVVMSSAAMFVGVYDGHGGPKASRFISSQLFPYLHGQERKEIEDYELIGAESDLGPILRSVRPSLRTVRSHIRQQS